MLNANTRITITRIKHSPNLALCNAVLNHNFKTMSWASDNSITLLEAFKYLYIIYKLHPSQVMTLLIFIIIFTWLYANISILYRYECGFSGKELLLYRTSELSTEATIFYFLTHLANHLLQVRPITRTKVKLFKNRFWAL